MDASIPPLPRSPDVPPVTSGVPRWLPWVNFGAGALCLLWMIPSWFIINGMFADLPAEVQPPAVLTYLLTAIPGIGGLALLFAGVCLARRQGYLLCLLASAATLLAGPVLIVGLLNIIQLTRPPVKAAFGRSPS
ncbi:hypothetical protein [Stenotrophomonas sp.]|uniref:hypothetical protein n=1 Tax=Stenotrophomonas sp. TaxID=69392 RepID=UPI0028A07BC0|nr:hypothetical protein [Stenotrophomonas sp.]